MKKHNVISSFLFAAMVCFCLFSFPQYSSGAEFDYTYITQSEYPAPMKQGETVELTLEIVNAGTQTWFKYKKGNPVVNLGTIPKDSTNMFYCSSNKGWASSSRVELTEKSVSPGQSAHFKFTICTKNVAPGKYRLNVIPVAEGITWMKDIGIYWDITVTDSPSSNDSTKQSGNQCGTPSSSRITRIDNKQVVFPIDGMGDKYDPLHRTPWPYEDGNKGYYSSEFGMHGYKYDTSTNNVHRQETGQLLQFANDNVYDEKNEIYIHAGIDYAVTSGKIYSVSQGIVLTGSDSGFGNYVLVYSRDKWNIPRGFLYAHLSKVKVASGKNICPGDYIGDVGNTGKSYGKHLHFAVLIPNDPNAKLSSNIYSFFGGAESAQHPLEYLVQFNYSDFKNPY